MESISDCKPSTSSLPSHSYHKSTTLFVLDAIRYFQEHPKYVGGIKEADLVEMWSETEYACGDTLSQVKCALKELCKKGFVRFIGNGYRTLGPFACLALARNPRQFNIAWERLSDMQGFKTPNTSTSFSSRTNSG